MVGVSEILNTVQMGLAYMVIALPLTLSYRVTQVINFVHIIFITLGAYTVALLGLVGLTNVWIAMGAAFLLGGALAVLDNVAVFEPLWRRGSDVLIIMVASLGLWIFYKYLIYAVLDKLFIVLRTNTLSVLVHTEGFPSVSLGGITIDGYLIDTVVASVIVSLALYLILMRTRIGKAIRAIADNQVLAEISGIPRGRVLNFMWFLSGGIAAVGGVLWALFQTTVTPEIGDQIILQVFSIAVIGGLYSLTKTAIGAFIVSGTENIVIAVLHDAFGLPLSFRPFLVFLVLLVVILIWPPLGAGGGLPYRFRVRHRSRR